MNSSLNGRKLTSSHAAATELDHPPPGAHHHAGATRTRNPFTRRRLYRLRSISRKIELGSPNGQAPVNNSYKITPSENTSVAMFTRSPRNCSGLA